MADKGQRGLWSLAAAARSAREARIAAVRYLRRAPVERQWYAAMLAHGHQARAALGGDPAAIRAVEFAVMGYAPPYPQDWEEAAAVVLAEEERCLAQADLYVLTPQMLDVVIAAAHTLDFTDLGLVTEDDLPSPAGVVVLPRPLIMRLPTGTLEHEVGFTWRSPWRIPLPERMDFHGSELPAVRMSSYTAPAHAHRDRVRAARAQGASLPPLLLGTVWSVPVHPRSPVQAQDRERLEAEVRRLNTTYWDDQSRRARPRGQDEVTAEYASGQIIEDDGEGTFASRFLYAFWRLCEQEIAAEHATEPGHSARVTAARVGVPPEVRVIALRRAASPSPPAGQAGPHQWHHHWVVRMHKVRQWYPSLQQHKVIYRGPLIKGDRTKPLLGGEVIRGLIR